jgi:flagellar L-ring protein precursor FlgH
MIRYTLVVAAVYFICCAMAWGQPAPATSAEPSRGAYESRTVPRVREPQAPVSADVAAANSLTEPPANYAAASSMAVPKKQPRTLKQHDLVQIIVREESQATTTGLTDLQKSSDLDAKVDSYVKLNLSKLSLDGKTPAITPEIKGEFSRNLKGQAQVDRTDTLTARIGAEVLDIKPNGTIVLQARKHIKTDDEEQEFVLTGVCRAEDVSPDNTILSNTLSDLDVRKSTKGAARDTTKRGWIPRLLDFANPF